MPKFFHVTDQLFIARDKVNWLQYFHSKAKILVWSSNYSPMLKLIQWNCWIFPDNCLKCHIGENQEY